MSIGKVQRLDNGDWVNWGRHWRSWGIIGYGPAKYYSGEAAEVLDLIFKRGKYEHKKR